MSRVCNRRTGEKYYYKAFGIHFVSDTLLPEFPKSTSMSADVQIVYGDVPKEIQTPLAQGEYYQIRKNELLFRVKGIAGYHVKNGRQIVVEPCGQADPHEVRLYLFGTAMGALLMQRDILPIHGSAVVIDGHCIVFTGVSGAGKSTMAAALHSEGYSLLADDIAALTFDINGRPWVHPGFPQQKLWKEAAAMIGIDTAPLHRISKDMNKYFLPVQAGFWGHPLPLTAIYEIDTKPNHNMTINPLKGMEKLTTIINHTYRTELLDGLGLKTTHFQKCADVAKQIPVFRLIRPEHIPSLDRQVNMLKLHVGKLFSRVKNA